MLLIAKCNSLIMTLNKCLSLKKKKNLGTSLVVQWLRLHASMARDVGSIPGQETKIPHKKKKKLEYTHVHSSIIHNS